MSSEYKCEYCNILQSTKNILDRHQKTSKKCIQIQESKGVFVNKIPACKYCKKEFHAKRLKEHEEKCGFNPPPNVTNIIIENLNITNQPQEDSVQAAAESCQEQYIYCLIEREFLKTKESIYKIGKTTKIFQRLQNYPKGSKLICFYNVKDSDLAERELIKELDANVRRAPEIGREYYNCELSVLLDIFHRIAVIHG